MTLSRRIAPAGGLLAAALVVVAGGAAAEPMACAGIAQAEHFLQGMRSGPEARAARRYLAEAKRARTEAACAAALRQVDIHTSRAEAADRRAAAREQAAAYKGKSPNMRCAIKPSRDEAGEAGQAKRIAGCTTPHG